METPKNIVKDDLTNFLGCDPTNFQQSLHDFLNVVLAMFDQAEGWEQAKNMLQDYEAFV